MEINNKKEQNAFSKIISKIYVSIKENAINTYLLFYISNIFEMTSYIIVIDIIFNYKRQFMNIYYFLYYISPIFYFEIFNCIITNKSNPEEIDILRYKYDLIYKLANKFDHIYILKDLLLQDYFYLKIYNLKFQNKISVKYNI